MIVNLIIINMMARRKDTRRCSGPIVGKEYTGKARIKPTDRMKPTGWGGLGTWRHAEGVPHACTARRTLLLEKITWGQVNPAREKMSPP